MGPGVDKWITRPVEAFVGLKLAGDEGAYVMCPKNTRMRRAGMPRQARF